MKWLLLVAMMGATLMAFNAPPAALFPAPELARVIFFHLPCAYATTFFTIFAAGCSITYLVKRTWVWEFRARAATELSFALGCATMLTGMLFSQVQWGAWWHWDPRQTSFLIVLLLLSTYFAIRMAYEDEVMRARVAAAYSALTLLPILFLIFVFPKLPQVVKNSLHPAGTVIQRKFSPDYWTVILAILVLVMFFGSWLYRMHVRASIISQKRKEFDGNLETTGGGTASHRVDRVVPVREPN